MPTKFEKHLRMEYAVLTAKGIGSGGLKEVRNRISGRIASKINVKQEGNIHKSMIWFRQMAQFSTTISNGTRLINGLS